MMVIIANEFNLLGHNFFTNKLISTLHKGEEIFLTFESRTNRLFFLPFGKANS